MVQTNTVQGPGGDAGLIRIKGTRRALAMSLDGNGRWCYLDPKLGAMHAVAESARNVACTGAKPVAATNCLNFGNPEKPPIMGQFAAVIDGMAAACEALGTPITGGNVSFYNETLGEAIYPTPVIGVVGILEDIGRRAAPDFVKAGQDVLLLGPAAAVGLKHAETELGSSEYAKEILGGLWGAPPALDLRQEAALHRCLIQIIGEGLAASVHDCSDGGLAVTLAECCFENGVGARIELKSELPGEAALFGEQATRVVISCDPGDTRRIQEIGVQYGLAAGLIGQTAPENLEIRLNGEIAVGAAVSELKSAWVGALPRMLHVQTREHLVPEVLQKS
jgi:phosphoribosylformylglycinamidine synthase